MSEADPRALLAQLRESISAARAMPLSASCLVNRGETLAMIDRLGAALPDSLAAADALLAQGGEVLATARQAAEELLAEARSEAERRLAESAGGAAAAAWADELRRRVEADVAAERAETEAFLDARLAHVEAVLGRTLALARMGSEPQPDAVGDVATRLGELAAEIDQMLVVVRRSREQMHGRSRMDELGDHLRAMDDAPEDPGTGLGTREQLG